MKHFIDGTLRNCISSAEPLSVVSPLSNEVIGTVALDDVNAARDAVDSCASTLKAWRGLAVHKRVDLLIKWYCWLQDHTPELADIISNENGKTKADAVSEMMRGIEVVQFSLSAPTYLKGEHAAINTGLDIYSRKEPLGVACGIAPFNFPGMIPLWMVPIALACGNTFVLKASELVPTCAVELARGAVEVGIPPGVFNVVQGGKDVVEYLCKEERVKAVTFVGSTRVGRIIERLAQGKRLQLNMGAKNHAVVMSDADLDKAAGAIVGAAFGGCGQRCMALSVVVSVGSNPEFEQLLVEKAEALTPTEDTGPLICLKTKKRLVQQVEAAIMGGAVLMTHLEETSGGYMSPTILGDVTTSMDIYKEELFGPVLCYIQVATLNEAILILNQNPYGNGCAIFTSETSHAEVFEKNVEVGQVGINVPIPVAPPYFSWTSTKDSFTGSHHVYGPESFDFYTQKRTVMRRSANKVSGSTIMPV
jgi:malonate-semialdehyde dehydrogenase (acetylating)/methylmalonate-semialdehyde dehydrogenase